MEYEEDELETRHKFHVKIQIIEVKHLIIEKGDVKMKISIKNQSKTVESKVQQSNAIFNKTFNFDFNLRTHDFFDTFINFLLYQTTAFGLSKKIIGNCEIKLETVWAQDYHHFYHKWAELKNSSNVEIGQQGYLKCDIYILSENGQNNFIPIERNNSDINNNLIIGDKTIRRKQVLYKLNIYRADGLTWRRKPNCQFKKNYKHLYVKVTFGFVTQRTNLCQKGVYPVWNEALTFIGATPSLHTTINIDLWDRQLKTQVGGAILNLSKLGNFSYKELLPVFGPGFLILYHEKQKNVSNFAGRILLSLESQFLENSTRCQEREIINPLDETVLPANEEFITFFAVFQAIFFSKKFAGNEVTLSITHGANFYTNDNDLNENSLDLYIPRLVEYTYGYGIVERRTEIPCAFIKTTWPDISDRIYITNRLQKCIKTFSERIDKCKGLMLMALKKRSIKEYEQALKDLSTTCTQLLTDKDISDREMLKQKLIKIKKSVKNTLALPQSEFLLSMMNDPTLEVLTDCIEDSNVLFPDFQINLHRKQKEFASFRINAENIFYSNFRESRGSYCGNLQTIWLKDPKKQSDLVVLEAFMWFGRKSEFFNCTKLLKITCDSKKPMIVTLKEHHQFQLRVYVYEGKFNKEACSTGFSDSYVRVLAFGQYQQTQVRRIGRNMLNPVWDETLLMAPQYIPGDYDFIKRESCGILVEVVDNDAHGAVIGRALIRPNVVLSDEKCKCPQMKWQHIEKDKTQTGHILMASEWVEMNENDPKAQTEAGPIPDNIRPHFVSCRIEVIFWGLRNLLPPNSNKIFAILDCNGIQIESNVVHYSKNLNFDQKVQFSDLEFPVEADLFPTITVTLYEIGWMKKTTARAISTCSSKAVYLTYSPKRFCNIFSTCKRKKTTNVASPRKPLVENITTYLKSALGRKRSSTSTMDDGVTDWWTRYYAVKNKQPRSGIIPLKIYSEELENQPQFNSFQDFLMPFTLKPLNKQKIEGKNKVGMFKGAIKIYTKSFAEHKLPAEGFFSTYFFTERKEITIRVYVVAGIDLMASGNCNPYITIAIGKHRISDKANYVYKDKNPSFGRMFEIKIVFPYDHSLRVRIMDHEAFFSDDLIGETVIDIENRYYTQHRAACGIPLNYSSWRDVLQPTDVLNLLCRISHIPHPTFSSNNNLSVAGRTFRGKLQKEEKALEALKRFHTFQDGFYLVPEHIETRSLFHPRKNMERGKLEMWVDIFPGYSNLPPPVIITPRKPLLMELRVIIWNTEKVLRVDTNILTGEKTSDIYVKGWLTSPEHSQKTDIHYRSLDGSGKFNWRFVFRFVYSPAERKMLVRHNEFVGKSLTDKIPCLLELQVFDSNNLMADNRIGALSLDLLDMPVGSRNARNCNLKMLDSKKRRINLFRVKKFKGWWPFRSDKENVQSGKVELEFDLVGEQEARKFPVGKGRDGPKRLPRPKRPDPSLLRLPNLLGFPLKVMKNFLGSINYRNLLPYILIALLVLFLFIAFTALPSLIMQKILNAI